jgi:NAD(P)-dependent dehydrogenase (short-subunit alcohol dehydrogenase family)
MKRVLITGANSDIGLATCKKYQEAGWFVIGHFRNDRDELNSLRGTQFESWQCDFSNLSSLEGVLKNRKSSISNIDAYVNLAAELTPVTFSNASTTEILHALSVNLLPGLLIMQSVGPAMTERGFGRIVHGSSIGVKFGGGEQSFAYSLSKHAQEFIPHECRKWAAKNVYVNIARIGATDTRIHSNTKNKDMVARANLIPAGRLATPQEIAETLYWLGSERNNFTTGENISIAGGE